jgi:hypothetical protein
MRSERINSTNNKVFGNNINLPINEDVIDEEKSKFNTSNELPSISTSKQDHYNNIRKGVNLLRPRAGIHVTPQEIAALKVASD